VQVKSYYLLPSTAKYSIPENILFFLSFLQKVKEKFTACFF